MSKIVFARCVTEHCDMREILVGATLRTLYYTVFKLGGGETTTFVSSVIQAVGCIGLPETMLEPFV
jgi:hypothetical protein